MNDSLSLSKFDFFYDKTQVLKSVTISVTKGELLCLTGPNGSGKSTLLNCLANQFHIKNPKLHAQSVAYLQQNENSHWNYKAYDIILMGRFCRTGNSGFYSKEDHRVAEEIIHQLRIENLADRNIFELSGGEFQKVKIARCLCQQPEFLLLDEPVANLDFSYQDELLSLIKEIARQKNIGVIISIHDLNTASRFADKISLLPKLKQNITGTPEEIFTQENMLETYGANFQIYKHPVYNCPQVAITH